MKGSYYQDVREAQASIGTLRESDSAFDYSARARQGIVQGVHPDLNAKGFRRECRDSDRYSMSTPIAVIMDVTRSRGKDARAIWEQCPSLMGSIRVGEHITDPQILWAAVGCADIDQAAVQIGQFEADRMIDTQLQKVWLEEGGAGTGHTSYELVAWYLAHRTDLDCKTKKRGKGFAFFTADEAPYPVLPAAQIENYYGAHVKSDILTTKVFADLQKSFHTFVVFPRTSMEERKQSINAEIQRRLESAGGRFKNVDIRASLLWNTRDDLDLHCMTPRGEHIYYGSKRAGCGGELDVDRNVRGEDPKPVENIRWAAGDAAAGQYRFWVEFYTPHQTRSGTVDFQVEIDVQGEIQQFSGKASAASLHKQIPVHRVQFAPLKKADVLTGYEDQTILSQWEQYIPAAQILRVQDAASTVEVMLGALALQSGKMDLPGFDQDMKNRRVAPHRRTDVLTALRAFAAECVTSTVDEDLFT